MNYTRSKILFLCSDNKLQIFKYPPFERMLCIDTCRINFVYQKMELQGDIAYLWQKKIIMILEHIQIFFRKMTSESRGCCNVNTILENRHRKHNVATKLVFGCSNDVGNTTLWQRYPTLRPKYNQNLTLLKRLVPTGNIVWKYIVHTSNYLKEISSCQLTLYLVNIKSLLMNNQIIIISSKYGKLK